MTDQKIFSEQLILNADLTDVSVLKKLIFISKNEPDDELRALARVKLQDKAIEIIERLTESNY